LNREVNKLKAEKISELGKVEKANKELKSSKKNDAITKKMASLSSAMDKLKAEHKDQQSKEEKATKELQTKLAAAEKRYTELESKKKEASAKKMAGLNREINKLKAEKTSQLGKVEKANKELQTKLADAESRYTKLESKMGEASPEKLAALNLAMSKLQSENGALSSKVTGFMSQLAASKKNKEQIDKAEAKAAEYRKKASKADEAGLKDGERVQGIC